LTDDEGLSQNYDEAVKEIVRNYLK
jgi:hypothetical protein